MDFMIQLHLILVIIQKTISFLGVLVILTGVLLALYSYFRLFFINKHKIDHHKHTSEINQIRLILGKRLILGLEFIVSADLIGTTTTPDYYSLGILGIIVVIRTVLSYSLNKEVQALTKET